MPKTKKTEHSGAKNGGGHWGTREEAKTISKKLRRAQDKLSSEKEILFRKTTASEVILLHDFYAESSEPDAPKKKFKDLDKKEQIAALSQFPMQNYQTLKDGNALIGFVGFFPDDDDNINIFYVISPDERSKGYFSKLLKAAIIHCRTQFAQFKRIRALTRIQNLSSTRGLEKASFIKSGQVSEEVQPDIIYDEYVLKI